MNCLGVIFTDESRLFVREKDMPKRTDIQSILVIGAGPIIIGQACEFDYSGVQAIKALKGEGYRVILVNSNPATIMTDPDLADATYIEPITTEASSSPASRSGMCAATCLIGKMLLCTIWKPLQPRLRARLITPSRRIR